MKIRLIRDKEAGRGRVPSQCANSASGKHVLLLGKLHQSAEGIADDPKNLEAYADMVQAIAEIARVNNIKWSDIETAAITQNSLNGGFRAGRYTTE